MFYEKVKCLQYLLKTARLPVFSNRQDERLLNNRILPPFTRNSWVGEPADKQKMNFKRIGKKHDK